MRILLHTLSLPFLALLITFWIPSDFMILNKVCYGQLQALIQRVLLTTNQISSTSDIQSWRSVSVEFSNEFDRFDPN
jgi:hypothetical protein